MPSKPVGSFRIQVFSNDHRPAHVHVFQGEMEIILILDKKGRTAHLRETKGNVPKKAVSDAIRAVEENFDDISMMWEATHGPYD